MSKSEDLKKIQKEVDRRAKALKDAKVGSRLVDTARRKRDMAKERKLGGDE